MTGHLRVEEDVVDGLQAATAGIFRLDCSLLSMVGTPP